MNADQIIDLIKFLAPIVIPAIVAGWTVWLQGQQEQNRNKQAREHQQDDRNAERQFAVAQERNRETRRLLETHKDGIEKVVETNSRFVDNLFKKYAETMSAHLTLEEGQQISETMPRLHYHLLYFDDPNLAVASKRLNEAHKVISQAIVNNDFDQFAEKLGYMQAALTSLAQKVNVSFIERAYPIEKT